MGTTILASFKFFRLAQHLTQEAVLLVIYYLSQIQSDGEEDSSSGAFIWPFLL